MAVERKDQRRLVTLTANVAGRDLGSVAADVQARLDEIPRPAGYQQRIPGDVVEQQKAFCELLLSLLLSPAAGARRAGATHVPIPRSTRCRATRRA